MMNLALLFLLFATCTTHGAGHDQHQPFYYVPCYYIMPYNPYAPFPAAPAGPNTLSADAPVFIPSPATPPIPSTSPRPTTRPTPTTRPITHNPHTNNAALYQTFFTACYECDVPSYFACIAEGVNPRARDKKDMSALHQATCNRAANPEDRAIIVQDLLQHFSSPDEPLCNHQTALANACANRCVSGITELLNGGASLVQAQPLHHLIGALPRTSQTQHRALIFVLQYAQDNNINITSLVNSRGQTGLIKAIEILHNNKIKSHIGKTENACLIAQYTDDPEILRQAFRQLNSEDPQQLKDCIFAQLTKRPRGGMLR